MQTSVIWTQKLTDYYPEVIYKKGKHNTNADALNRAFPVESKDNEWEDIDRILDGPVSTPSKEERAIVQELQDSLRAIDSQASDAEELPSEEEEKKDQASDTEEEREDNNLIVSKVKLDVYTRIILRKMPDEEIEKRIKNHRNYITKDTGRLKRFNNEPILKLKEISDTELHDKIQHQVISNGYLKKEQNRTYR